MTLLFVLLTVVAVVVIALVSVGGVTARLAAAPPRSLFDLDEAVEFVAELLPESVTARVSYDELRSLLGWHVEYLAAKGVAAETDPGHALDIAVLAFDDEGIAFVLGRAADAGLEVDDVAVVEIIEAEAAYLEAIGAIGGPVGSSDEPGA